MAAIIQGFYGQDPYGDSYYGGSGRTVSKIYNRIYFLVNNHVEEVNTTTMTVPSFSSGFFGNTRTTKTGFGTISIVGDYIGNTDIVVRVQVVSLGTGTGEVTAALSTSPKYQVSIDNGVTWDTNSGLYYTATSAGTDNPVILTNLGIVLYWTNSNSGVSFQIDDLYSFSAVAQYRPQHLLDWSTRTSWRSGSASLVNIDIDFGVTGVRVNAFGIRGLNFTPGLSNYVTLYSSGQSFDTWNNIGAVISSYPCVISSKGTAGMVLQDDTVEHQYWRVSLNPAAGVIPEASHFFLGEAVQLTRDVDKNYGYQDRVYLSESKISTGQTFASVHGKRTTLTAKFSLLQEEDRIKIADMWETVNPSGSPVRPFYTVNLPNDPSNFMFSVFDQNTSNLTYQTRKRMTWDAKFREA